eukprot:scaffold895_cov315-Pinguiococcus_pyrenoidosus.AAC.15
MPCGVSKHERQPQVPLCHLPFPSWAAAYLGAFATWTRPGNEERPAALLGSAHAQSLWACCSRWKGWKGWKG